jgi:hypothetical protein
MRLDMLRPLRHRDFRLLFIGQLVSMKGNQLYFVALPFQILALHGSGGLLTFACWSIARTILRRDHRDQQPETAPA